MSHTYTTDEIRDALCTQIRNVLAAYERTKAERHEYLMWYREHVSRDVEADSLEKNNREFAEFGEKMKSFMAMFDVANEQLAKLPIE